MNANFHIITGGPGSGKSALVAALAARGFRHMPEAGRTIIQDQVAIGGSALPWSDRAAFAELMLSWDLRSYREASVLHESVLFDRGIPDVLGYLTLCGLAVPGHVRKAAELHRYHRQVFIAPHWPAIFGQDRERKQSTQEAEATYRVMEQTYSSLGYELIVLPLASVSERAAFVESRVRSA